MDSKEREILMVMRKVLTSIIRDITPSPGQPSPLTEETSESVRDCLKLIALRERELADELGIAMDMSIMLKTESGSILTLSLSFNNDGPLGTFFRYICDNGTYIARYDDLVDGYEKEIDVSAVDVSMNGIELQDREFVAAIREGRESRASIGQVLECYRVLNAVEQQFSD